jgi:hypothetical protein
MGGNRATTRGVGEEARWRVPNLRDINRGTVSKYDLEETGWCSARQREEVMPMTRFQVTVAARHPGRLAEFWAAALGYVPEEDTPEYLESLQAMGYDPAERAEWEAAIVDPEGRGPRLYFERVEATASPMTLHLDISAGAENAEAEADRLVRLGAHQEAKVRADCIEMSDPEGNRFCIQ